MDNARRWLVGWTLAIALLCCAPVFASQPEMMPADKARYYPAKSTLTVGNWKGTNSKGQIVYYKGYRWYYDAAGYVVGRYSLFGGYEPGRIWMGKFWNELL